MRTIHMFSVEPRLQCSIQVESLSSTPAIITSPQQNVMLVPSVQIQVESLLFFGRHRNPTVECDAVAKCDLRNDNFVSHQIESVHNSFVQCSASFAVFNSS